MKVKNLSKVLAFMVAVVMIFAALPIMANADTAADAFVVSYAAPAIPMNENTKVDLKTLAVEIAAGTTVSGADVEWATDVTEGIVLDATNKTVEALAKGNYKLTATANDVTKNVWVIVKSADETDIYLVNIPIMNTSTFIFNEWRSFGQKATSVGTPSTLYSSGSDYVQLSFGTGYVYYDEIFKDFADYTIAARMASQSAAVNASEGAGTVGRVVIEDNKTTGGIISYIRINGQVGVRKPTAVSSYGYCGTASISYTTGDPTKNFWGRKEAVHDVVTIHSGEVTQFYADGKLFLDTSINSTNYQAKNQTAAGYPGVMSYGSNAYLFSFAVKLNSNEMPAVMVDEPAPTADITIVGEGTATVDAVVGAENQYTLTLAPATGYKVKLGSVVINGEVAHGAGDSGRVYTFTAENLNEAPISVEYIEDNGQFNTVMLGAQVNPEKSGIRFGARTDSIKRAAENANAGLLDNRLLVDGETYEIDEIGMILVPSQLLKGAELTVGGKYVVKQPVSKIVGLTNDFADIAITLTGIPETQLGVMISSRMYVAYTDAEGVTQYIYTDVIERSYNGIIEAMGQ